MNLDLYQIISKQDYRVSFYIYSIYKNWIIVINNQFYFTVIIENFIFERSYMTQVLLLEHFLDINYHSAVKFVFLIVKPMKRALTLLLLATFTFYFHLLDHTDFLLSLSLLPFTALSKFHFILVLSPMSSTLIFLFFH